MAASSALVFPVRNASGARFYLSAGQRVTLTYGYHRIRGAGPVTLAQIARATGTTRGVVSKRLDRLASLGLLGRRSRVGRGHRTLLWIPRARSSAARSALRAHGCSCARCRSDPNRTNVPTSTPFGGYMSAEGFAAAHRGGSPPGLTAGPPPDGGRSRRRRRTGIPPRLLYTRCPGGHRTRLTRHSWSRDRATLRAAWSGICRRCGLPTIHATELVVPEPTRTASRPTRIALEDFQWLSRTQ